MDQATLTHGSRLGIHGSSNLDPRIKVWAIGNRQYVGNINRQYVAIGNGNRQDKYAMAMVVVVVVVVVVSLGAHIGRSNEFIGREVWVWVYGWLIDPSFLFLG